jgi:cytochrome c-type biogenesis protein CcmH
MAWFRALLIATLICGVSPALAVQPDEMLPDPAMEARARELSRELRCMVCQNQSIDDSDAPLARDLRLLVRERIKAGDSNAEVIEFLTARYGDFVLLKPRFNAQTALLWLMPAIVLMLGGGALIVLMRRQRTRRVEESPAPLSASERARLADMIDDEK